MPHLRYCTSCAEYMLDEVCKRCGKPTRSPVPPRFSPEDHYGKYRRALKRHMKGE